MLPWFNIQLRYHDQLRLAGIASVLGLAILTYGILTNWPVDQIDLNDHPLAVNVPLFQVNLNDCQWYELVILPGIGETLAKAIVEHRKQSGDFLRIEQIQDVNGIGPGKFEQLAPHLLLNE